MRDPALKSSRVTNRLHKHLNSPRNPGVARELNGKNQGTRYGAILWTFRYLDSDGNSQKEKRTELREKKRRRDYRNRVIVQSGYQTPTCILPQVALLSTRGERELSELPQPSLIAYSHACNDHVWSSASAGASENSKILPHRHQASVRVPDSHATRCPTRGS
jgi:hypothetical protein